MTIHEEITFHRMTIAERQKNLGSKHSLAGGEITVGQWAASEIARLERVIARLEQAKKDEAEERHEMYENFRQQEAARVITKTADLNAPWLVATGDQRVEACTKRLIE